MQNFNAKNQKDHSEIAQTSHHQNTQLGAESKVEPAPLYKLKTLPLAPFRSSKVEMLDTKLSELEAQFSEECSGE